MSTPISTSTLDQIVAIQLTVAWAGEGKCEPRRLGWWQTDLVDDAGGGDLFRRLLPHTHAWASLEAVREAARCVDERARKSMSQPDRLRTLFHLGFELDERLHEQLTHYKREGRLPHEALPELIPFSAPLERNLLERHLDPTPSLRTADYLVVPGGRELVGPPPAAPGLLVRRLASALMPLGDQYPCPFFRLES